VLKLGSKAFSIRAGQTATVKIRLSRKGRRLLVRLKRVKAKATAKAHDEGGRQDTASRTVKLKRAKKPRRHKG